ncbi:MAG: argininosuccinate synthase [Thaumarchaeota archaeon]|nr:argininosuccinate synthase [Nitrososphaerota archaeon]
MKKIVLAYSGGLDTSVCVPWLKENYDAEIVTMTVDIGQVDDLAVIQKKAEDLGVLNHYSIDARQEFCEGYIFPCIRANGLYQNKYPLGTALSRPLIATKLVDIAKKEGAVAVAHGSTGKGNDQVRFEVTIKGLDPSLEIIAPIREWNLTRDQELDYAQKNNIVLGNSSEYSIDENLWGRSIEGGKLEDPGHEPNEEIFQWVTPPTKALDNEEEISLSFVEGIPKRLNGVEMGPVDLILEMNRKLGAHGIGIIDHIEDRLVGIKSREVYECPAAIGIIEAHKELEKLVLTRRELSFKQRIEEEWAWLVYSGLWLEPLRYDLEAFIALTQKKVDGEVKMKLYKGNLRVSGRSSPSSLYDYAMATYEASSTFDQTSSSGFVELWGLGSRTAFRALQRGEVEKNEK